MNSDAQIAELLPLNTIRTETVLSRFPVHRLSKRGHINIEIKETNAEGELKTKWKVSHNSEYGQPGPLEYKLDTIFINRKIEEAGQPIPNVIRLGSRHEIAGSLGLGRDTNTVKKALLKNASAFITVKRTYHTKDGVEKKIEAAFTRYSLVFTGEKLPDGTRADAVHLILNDNYREILNTAQTRPLDYDYLKELTPGAQRLYELLSYQIFAAIRNNRPRARMLYSYFCARAPQTRYYDYDHVKKQMYKLHAPHKRAEYISTVELRETIDGEGQLDWEMFYTPGKRAKAEFRAFTRPKMNKSLLSQIPQTEIAPIAETNEPTEEMSPVEIESTQSDVDPLFERLVGFGVAETKAKELIASHRAVVERQLAAHPHRLKQNPAGLLIAAIEQDYDLPSSYLKAQVKQETKRQSDAARKEQEATQRREASEQKLRLKAKERFLALPKAEQERLIAERKEILLKQPEWSKMSKTISKSLLTSAARDALIEELMTAETMSQSGD